jgi:beta-lactamase regulating signal transducer with metallopeptidase domain
LEFIYQPASVVLGLWLAGLSAIALLGWVAVIRLRSRQNQSPKPAYKELDWDDENFGL